MPHNPLITPPFLQAVVDMGLNVVPAPMQVIDPDKGQAGFMIYLNGSQATRAAELERTLRILTPAITALKNTGFLSVTIDKNVRPIVSVLLQGNIDNHVELGKNGETQIILQSFEEAHSRLPVLGVTLKSPLRGQAFRDAVTAAIPAVAMHAPQRMN